MQRSDSWCIVLRFFEKKDQLIFTGTKKEYKIATVVFV